jgi:GntP family gluconate:H+ symporter
MTPLILLFIGMAVVLGGILVFKLHPFVALIGAAFVVAFLTPLELRETFVQFEKMSDSSAEAFLAETAPKRVVEAFGSGCGKVGIVIAMAAIIGKCLLESGSAQRMVQALLSLVGMARAHIAFLISGFVLAVPVFFDTVFFLLVPLARAAYRKTNENYLLYIMCIVAGGTMAHSLVPPTPGPLLAAEAMGVGFGTMALGGIIVGAFTVTFGYLFARWVNRRHPIPMREEANDGDATSRSSGEEYAGKLPPLWLALLPVALPVVLLATGTILPFYVDWATASGWPVPTLVFKNFVAVLGDKNLALTLAAGVAMLALTWQHRRNAEVQNRTPLKDTLQSALMSGAVIVLITAAGAAFGGVLKQTGIAASLQDWGRGSSTSLLPLVFVLTALVRTAQGSATVAMLTAAPVAASFIGPDLNFHPVYLALAVGCGSKPIPWMNDSGFWIVTRMSGFKESETLRTITPMMSLMGVCGLAVVMVGAWLLPGFFGL